MCRRCFITTISSCHALASLNAHFKELADSSHYILAILSNLSEDVLDRISKPWLAREYFILDAVCLLLLR